MGIEPMTSSLPRKCSTTELQQRVRPAPCEAGRVRCAPAADRRQRGGGLTVPKEGDGGGRGARGMERAMGVEPTLSAWKAEVLPLNYARVGHACLEERGVRGAAPAPDGRSRRGGNGQGPARGSAAVAVLLAQAGEGEGAGGERRIRTAEGENHQIYSLAHLAALESPRPVGRAGRHTPPLGGLPPRPRDRLERGEGRLRPRPR